MIVFISREDDDLKVQNLINITCYEVLSKLRDVDKRQILYTMFIRDINDEKTSSDLIEFFLERRINHLSIRKTLFSFSKIERKNRTSSYLFSISKKDVSLFFRIESSFTINHHIIVHVSRHNKRLTSTKLRSIVVINFLFIFVIIVASSDTEAGLRNHVM